MVITCVETLLSHWALYVYGIPKRYRPHDGSRGGDRSGLSAEGQAWLRVCGQRDYKRCEQALRARYGRFEVVDDPDLDAWIQILAADLLRAPLLISDGSEFDDTPPPLRWRKGGAK